MYVVFNTEFNVFMPPLMIDGLAASLFDIGQISHNNEKILK